MKQLRTGNYLYWGEEQFLSTLNRILLSRKVEVRHEKGGDLAYANLKDSSIHINMDAIRRKCSANMVEYPALLKGINYHEAGHLEYTPPDLMQSGDLCSFRTLLNVVEDGRIETLKSTTQPRTAGYFRYTNLKFLAENMNDKVNPDNFLLAYAKRLFIAPTIVAMLHDAFVHKYGEGVAVEAQAKIDEYLSAHTTEELRKKAKELYDLLCIVGQPDITDPSGEPQYTGGQMTKTKTAQAEKTTAGAQDALDKARDGVEKAIREREGDSDSAEDGHDGCGNEKGKDGEEDFDERELFDEVSKAIQERVQAERESLTEDAVEAMNDISVIDRSIYSHQFRLKESSPAMAMRAKKLADQLRKLQTDVTNRYVPNHKSGRVSMRKYIQSQAGGFADTKIFSKYRPSVTGETSIGVVILVDMSSSMGYLQVVHAMKGAWVAHEAVTSIRGNHCMVIGYNYNPIILKDWDSYMNWKQVESSGGTNAESAYNLAERKIEELRKAEGIQNFIVISLTDGDWANGEGAGEIIARMREKGVVTSESGLRCESNHGSEYCASVPTIDDFVSQMIMVIRQTAHKVTANVAKKQNSTI